MPNQANSNQANSNQANSNQANSNQAEDSFERQMSKDEKRTSHSLIAKVQTADTEAWQRLVDLYSPLILFWCRKSGLPSPDLDDIFQDVFHAVALNIKKYQPREKGSFRGWLRTLTRNKINDHFRKGPVSKPVGGTEALHILNQLPDRHVGQSEKTEPGACCLTDTAENDNITEQDLENALLRQALTNIRDQFTELTWQSFVLVAIHGRSAKDVAADLGVTPGNVRVAKCRILKRLRLELGDSIV